MDSQTAVLLIAHGSRRAAANDDLPILAERVRARGFPRVQVAYLELAEPSIPEGLRLCAFGGATTILMLPYFLSAGRHVTDDLEQFRREFVAQTPGVNIVICPPLGLHPLMTEIVLARLQEGAANI